MRLSILCAFAVSALCAQDAGDLFNKPPADVDRALRARISEFYDMHVKGEFRKAENLVAEDSKDFYYDHNKPTYLSFEIAAIKYSDHFTQAEATVLCEQRIMFPGFAGKPMKVPTPSYWKLVDGQWYWWVDQAKLSDSPFGGKWTPGPEVSTHGIPTNIPSTVAEFRSMVKADRLAVTLAPGHTERVVISNTAPGIVMLDIHGLPGIDAKLDVTALKAGGQATLTLTASDGAQGGTLEVRVNPTGEVIPIRVTLQ